MLSAFSSSINASRLTPGISGERPHDIHESGADARVRCAPLFGGGHPEARNG
jgi:hypothetical protein